MASMADASCTCEPVWQGTGERPLCRTHERGKARRKSDGAIVDVQRSAGVFPEQREAGTWSSDVTQLSGVVRYQ